MKKVIVVANWRDIYPALALQQTSEPIGVVVFDPLLLDKAREAGLRDVKLHFWERDAPFSALEKAREQADFITAAVDGELARIIPEAEGARWQYHNIFNTLNALYGYATLWAAVCRQCPDLYFHVPVANGPARYGFHSFAPGLLLLERLHGDGRKFEAFLYDLPEVDPEMVPVCDHLSAAGQFELFSHLPTCTYDQSFIEEEIAASGKKCLHFPSHYWDVSMKTLQALPLASADDVIASLDIPRQKAISGTVIAIEKLFTQLFQDIFASEQYVSRQAACFAGMIKAQIAFYEGLVSSFSSRPPKKLFLSSHDGGLHGAFFSFAKRSNIPVVLFPHAKVFNTPVCSGQVDTLCLTHPIQGGEISTGEGRRLMTGYVGFPEIMEADGGYPKDIESIGVIVNGVSTNGVGHIDLSMYINGLRKIKAWCDKHQISCRIRCKPTETFLHWLADELRLEYEELTECQRGGIAAFAEKCDLCLVYDSPTSGVIDLLRNSIPVLNPVDRMLTAGEEAQLDPKIVPRGRVDEILRRLEVFIADRNTLFAFRREQFGSYVAAQTDALPLRMFL